MEMIVDQIKQPLFQKFHIQVLMKMQSLQQGKESDQF